MAYMALYRKWRSQTFDEIVGQEAVVTALRNQILYNRIGHAYLFCGTRGTGKTSMAKIFARAVNCLHPVNGNPCNECELCRESETGFNLIEIDAASNNGVDNIREIRDEVQYAPARGRYRVYIIDEVHMLSQGAFNALLKTLEEPPEHVIFILATTEPHKVLPTIVSRCQRYDFKRFTAAEIFNHLKNICRAESLQATDDALHYIARAADGGMRDALSIMEQCTSFYMGQEITLAKVLDILGMAGAQDYFRLTDALAARRTSDSLHIIGEAFMAGRDVSAFTTGLISHLRSVLMMKAMGMQGAALLELGDEEARDLLDQAGRIPAEQLTYFIEQLTDLESRMKYANEKRVLLEVEVIRLCRMASETGDRALEARIAAVEKKVEDGVIPVQAPQPPVQEAKPARPQKAPEERPKAKPLAGDDERRTIIEQWEAIKRRIVKAHPNMHILGESGLQPDPRGQGLIVTNPFPITLRQLEANDGEKLRMIEEAIEAETGVRITLRTGEPAPQVRETGRPQVDLDNLLTGINFPVNIE